MAIDLFSLLVNFQTTGVNNVKADLETVDATGKRAAASLQRTTSESLNGTKGFRDLSAAYRNQDAVMASLALKQDTVTDKLDKGTEATKKHAEGIKGMVEPLKRLAEAYLVFQAIDFVKGSIEQAAALHELSQKTGASVEMLSVLEFAGRRANVTTGQLAMGFRGLSLSLGNLRDGQDKTVEAFKKLGLTYSDFAGLNTDQAFRKIVDAIAKLPDGLQKSEVAARVFGRSGAELLPLLADLAHGGFDEVTRAAEKLGIVVSGKVSESADKLVDTMGDLKFQFQALAREVIPPLVSILSALNTQLNTGPGQTWRNTMREITAAVDGVTRLATLGFWGTHLSDNFRGDGTSDWDAKDTGPSKAGGQRNRGEGLVAVPELTEAQKAAITEARRREKEAAAQHRREMLALLNYDRPNRLDAGPLDGPPPQVRGGFGDIANLTVPAAGRGRGGGQDEFWFDKGKFAASEFFKGLGSESGQSRQDRWQLALVGAATSVRSSFESLGASLGMTLANGFSSAMAAGVQGKNMFKAFGTAVLQGLGSIFTQMGAELITYGIIMLNLLPFLSNPFTSGFAAIAAGTALVAAGTILGGIATSGGRSGGGSGSSAPRDTVTNITLTPNGAGGFSAPAGQTATVIEVLGVDSPKGQRIIGQYTRNAARRGIR